MINPPDENKTLLYYPLLEGQRQKQLEQLAIVSQAVTGAGIQHRYVCYASAYLGYLFTPRSLYSHLHVATVMGGGGNMSAASYLILTRLPHTVGEYITIRPSTLADFLCGQGHDTLAAVWTNTFDWLLEALLPVATNTDVYTSLWFGGSKVGIGQPDYTAYGQLMRGSIRVHGAWQ